MERDYGAEIDELKEELKKASALFGEFLSKQYGQPQQEQPQEERYPYKNDKVWPMRHMHPDPRLSSMMNELCETVDGNSETGAVTYMGVFTSGGRQSNWIRNGIGTDSLLALVDSKSAGTVLQSIGNSDKLALLVALLREPMTVAQMVEKCGFNTTGQVYHHLRPLIAADIVEEVKEGNERGVYAVKYHRVQGIIMLLAGIADLIDPFFSNGTWTPDP